MHFGGLATRTSFLLICIFAGGCAASTGPSIKAGSKAQPGAVDEKELWEQSDWLDRAFAEGEYLLEDDDLDIYLDSLASELAGGDVGVRVRVIKNPEFNAFAMPNGSIYVHTGMLASLENEAQFAAVLGHEIAHYTEHHSLRTLRSAQAANTIASLFAIGAVGVGAAFGGQLGANVAGAIGGHASSVWALASITGYSREFESQADELGFAAMRDAGYDTTQAAQAFEVMLATTDKKHDSEDPSYFYATHPRLRDRIVSMQELSEQTPPGGTNNRERYLLATAPALLANAAMGTKLGDYDKAQSQLHEYIQRVGETPQVYFELGELRRVRGEGGDFEEAIAAYERAIQLDASFANAHKEIGMVARRLGDMERSRRAFKSYLTYAPGAADAPIIRGYLKRM